MSNPVSLLDGILSFVNLEEEFPEMMVTQRNYEANLKVLQTHDKMLGTLLDATG